MLGPGGRTAPLGSWQAKWNFQSEAQARLLASPSPPAGSSSLWFDSDLGCREMKTSLTSDTPRSCLHTQHLDPWGQQPLSSERTGLGASRPPGGVTAWAWTSYQDGTALEEPSKEPVREPGAPWPPGVSSAPWPPALPSSASSRGSGPCQLLVPIIWASQL